MPARKIHRTLRSHIGPSGIHVGSGDAASSKYSGLDGTPQSILIQQPLGPKHIPFNSSRIDNDFAFELRMFMYTTIGAICQFLHIYRSIWWLPYTAMNYPVNYFLIDPSLVAFIVALLSRRLVFGIIGRLIKMWMPEESINAFNRIFRVSSLIIIGSILCIFGCEIMNNHSIINILYVCYPLVVYIILFGLKITPLFELETMNSNGLPPLHACTNVAADIRAEVEELKRNFNMRVKQILFNSVINAYYSGLLPCCFVQNFVYYDIKWAAQHVGVLWLGCFMAYTVHTLPVRYCDTLHRSALHLGYWDKIEPSSHTGAIYPWRDDILWPFGSVVKHGKDLYRSLAEVNAAEPGNSSNSRFYTIFWNPPLPLTILLMIQVSLVLFEIIFLISSYNSWHNIISSSLLLVYNYYTLYIVGRNFFVSQRLYNLEQAMHEKATN